MFSKVLVAEDYEIANQGIVKVLNERIGIYNVHEVKYCDDAYLKFRKAHQDNDPFELLITDLSFKKDHRKQKRNSGIELITDICEIQPNIKTIVYSQESRPDKINMLFEKLNINGYVCKGQEAIQELVNCVCGVYAGKIVFPPILNDALREDDMVDLDDIDMILLEGLSKGFTKKEIREELKSQNIEPNGESFIDKKVRKLFDDFKAKNTTHLVAIVKDLGLL